MRFISFAARCGGYSAQTVIERATVWIEASTEAEAAKLALTEDAEWRFAEAYGDIEVIGVEEVKP